MLQLPSLLFFPLTAILPVPTLSRLLLSLRLTSVDVFLPSRLYFTPLPTLLSCLSPLSLLPPSPPSHSSSEHLSAFSSPLPALFSSWLTHKTSTRAPKHVMMKLVVAFWLAWFFRDCLIILGSWVSIFISRSLHKGLWLIVTVSAYLLPLCFGLTHVSFLNT